MRSVKAKTPVSLTVIHTAGGKHVSFMGENMEGQQNDKGRDDL